MGLELMGERRIGLPPPREDHDPAGVTIEALVHADIRPAEMSPQPSDDVIRAVRLRGLRGYALRFEDDDEIVIGVEDPRFAEIRPDSETIHRGLSQIGERRTVKTPWSN
jgi:hypothetical protein